MRSRGITRCAAVDGCGDEAGGGTAQDDQWRVSGTKSPERWAELVTVLRFFGLQIAAGGVVIAAEQDTGSVARRLHRDISEVYGLARSACWPVETAAVCQHLVRVGPASRDHVEERLASVVTEPVSSRTTVFVSRPPLGRADRPYDLRQASVTRFACSRRSSGERGIWRPRPSVCGPERYRQLSQSCQIPAK
jgi:hypothetical protein